MKRVVLATALTFALPAFAAHSKTYQVTGEVTELTDDTMTVNTGKESFEIARSGDTRTMGELRKGATVTVEYRMTAVTVTVKGNGNDPGKSKGAGKSEDARKKAK